MIYWPRILLAHSRKLLWGLAGAAVFDFIQGPPNDDGMIVYKRRGGPAWGPPPTA